MVRGRTSGPRIWRADCGNRKRTKADNAAVIGILRCLSHQRDELRPSCENFANLSSARAQTHSGGPTLYVVELVEGELVAV